MQYDGFSLVDESSGIAHYRLDQNGLDILLVPIQMAPVAVFMVTYRVGSRNESMGETGATHFLEHLMFKGSENFNTANGNSIFNTLQRIGARVNATTWLDRTNYYEMLPDDNLDVAIQIEADRMRGATLDPKDVNSERSVILNELDRGENEPLRRLYQSVWSTAFLAHPYRHPTIGWRSDVEHISQEQLRSFYDTFYWPNNATISVIGSLDESEVLGSILRYFGNIPTGPDLMPEVRTVEPVQIGERRTTIRMAGELGAVMIGFKAPAASHRLMPALSVLAVILGSGKSCRLYRHVVDSGLATSVSANDIYLRDPGLFYLYAMLTSETEHAVLENALMEVVESVISDPVSSDELASAKAQLRAETAFDRDGPFAMASGLNEAIAAGDWKLYTRIPKLIDGTTTEQVLEAARTVFDRSQMTIGYFDPIKTLVT